MRETRGSKKGERRGGRQKGTPNKNNSKLVAKARAEAAGMLPHEWLWAVARGDKIEGMEGVTQDVRIRCAESAAPYFAAKRKEISGPGGGPIATVDYSKMSAAQLEALEPVLASLVRAGA